MDRVWVNRLFLLPHAILMPRASTLFRQFTDKVTSQRPSSLGKRTESWMTLVQNLTSPLISSRGLSNHLFIHQIFILSHYGPGSVWCIGNTIVNMADRVPALIKVTFKVVIQRIKSRLINKVISTHKDHYTCGKIKQVRSESGSENLTLGSSRGS